MTAANTLGKRYDNGTCDPVCHAVPLGPDAVLRIDGTRNRPSEAKATFIVHADGQAEIVEVSGLDALRRAYSILGRFLADLE